MYLLFPGRHHLLTNFQFQYLQLIIHEGIAPLGLDGQPLRDLGEVQALIFAVTSANHSNTRRNPLPFYLRAIALEAFGAALGIPTYIYGVDDVGALPNFADYTLKRIRHESEGRFDLSPANSAVVCSTQVLEGYRDLGFPILPAELADAATGRTHAEMPWDLVERIAACPDWRRDPGLPQQVHPASWRVWWNYGLGDKVQLLFRDAMIGSDGDLTATRDYNVYVRQMDEIAEMKYRDTAPFIQPGRIGDIGCAVGSWIRQACADDRFRESDFYGIEVSRPLYEICLQRKSNGEFANPFVFFAQRNAVTGLSFEAGSMNTIHTSSLTHEIESYGSRADLLQFIRNRHAELAPGGVWINRDPVGPDDKERTVWLWLDDSDGDRDDATPVAGDRREQKAVLDRLSTRARFFRFAAGFRRDKGYSLAYKEVTLAGRHYLELSLRDAAEYLLHKDYTDNWDSELHETYCFWSFSEWKAALEEAGFRIHPDSKAYTNDWIRAQRWEGKAALYAREGDDLQPLDFPVTTMLLIGVKS
ncbi:transferase [Flaviaesturariibacter amylovorans]|uniref:Transferase n=1 Tax=Flaviaesturariibacter amylovorans TaxID=1084520 RepID=A0ABP8HKM2_9BACT